MNKAKQPNQQDQIPHNQAAEESIISAVILNNNNMREVEDIDPACFYNPTNQLIFKHCLKLWDNQQPIDVITLRQSINESGQSTPLIMGEIDRVHDAGGFSSYIKAYRETVLKCAYRRKMMDLCKDGYYKALRDEDIQGSTEEMLTSWVDLADKGLKRRTQDFSEIIPVIRAEYDTKSDNKLAGNDKQLGYRCGFHLIDDIIGGLRPESYIIVAARPSVGKTAFALDLAYRVSEGGGFVLFLSLEMSLRSLINRLLAKISGVPSLDIDRVLLPDQRHQLNHAWDELELKDFRIETRYRNINELKYIIRQTCHQKENMALVVVDYFQLIQGGQGKEYERLTTISQQLKGLAGDCHVPIMLLAQENRESVDKTGLATIKGSGQTEQDADIVMLLKETGKKNKKGSEECMILNIAKHRFGKRSQIYLRFRKDLNRFYDYETENDCVGDIMNFQDVSINESEQDDFV